MIGIIFQIARLEEAIRNTDYQMPDEVPDSLQKPKREVFFKCFLHRRTSRKNDSHPLLFWVLLSTGLCYLVQCSRTIRH